MSLPSMEKLYYPSLLHIPEDDEATGLELLRVMLKHHALYNMEMKILSKEHKGVWSWGVYLDYKAEEITVHGEAPTLGRAMKLAVELVQVEIIKKAMGSR